MAKKNNLLSSSSILFPFPSMYPATATAPSVSLHNPSHKCIISQTFYWRNFNLISTWPFRCVFDYVWPFHSRFPHLEAHFHLSLGSIILMNRFWFPFLFLFASLCRMTFLLGQRGSSSKWDKSKLFSYTQPLLGLVVMPLPQPLPILRILYTFCAFFRLIK